MKQYRLANGFSIQCFRFYQLAPSSHKSDPTFLVVKSELYSWMRISYGLCVAGIFVLSCFHSHSLTLFIFYNLIIFVCF